MQILANAAGELLDVFAVDVHEIKIPIAGPRGCESNLASIGAEAGLHIVSWIIGELDDTRSIDALKINVRALTVTRAGKSDPLAARIENDVGVMTFIRRSMLLKRKVGPRFAGAIDGRPYFSVDILNRKKGGVGKLRLAAAILRN